MTKIWCDHLVDAAVSSEEGNEQNDSHSSDSDPFEDDENIKKITNDMPDQGLVGLWK